jgi:hypothetical protein
MKCLMPSGYFFYKYEKNTFTEDKCYVREIGQWKPMKDWPAKDWSCNNHAQPQGSEKGQKLFNAVFDFITLTHSSEPLGPLPCVQVELPD